MPRNGPPSSPTASPTTGTIRSASGQPIGRATTMRRTATGHGCGVREGIRLDANVFASDAGCVCPKTKYRCSKGLEWEDQGTWIVKAGEVEIGPLCLRCLKEVIEPMLGKV